MPWTHVSAALPSFVGECIVDLPVPCSYDFNLAVTKYFDALEDGEIPLCFLFSGTIFHEAPDGDLKVVQISWEKEAYYRLCGHLAHADEPVLSQHRLAVFTQRHFRPTFSIQEPSGPTHLGTDTGAAAVSCRGAGEVMNRALVDPIADAILYEGYILYPYRPSVKNRHRWTFGGLYPDAYCQAQRGSDASGNQTECLIQGTPATRFEAVVRFLHLTSRQAGAIDPPLTEWPLGDEPEFCPVETLHVDNRQFQSWQEAEGGRFTREVTLAEARLRMR